MPQAKKQLRLLIVGLKWPAETFLAQLFKGLLGRDIELTVTSSTKPSQEWLDHPNFRWLHTPSWDVSIVSRGYWLCWLWLGAAMRSLLRRAWSMEQGGKSKEHGAGSVEHGGKSKEHGAWSMEQGGKSKEHGAGSMEQGGGSEESGGGLEKIRERIRRTYRYLPFIGRTWDVIYFPWNSGAIDYSELMGIGIPSVISCRGAQINIAPHNPKRRRIKDELRTTFQGASKVHCVCEAIRTEAESYGLDPAKTVVITPAVDIEFFSPARNGEKPENRLRIVTTGSLIWRKGYEYALTGVYDTLSRGIEIDFSIIGDGPERQRLLYTIHDLKLTSQVKLLGNLTREAVRSELQNSHVFLLSSVSEGISNAALEAMACGLPVITTDCGGMTELITDGVDGLTVPVRDSAAIAMAIATLSEDKKLRDRMGRKGREKVCTEYSLESQIDQFEELICNTATRAEHGAGSREQGAGSRKQGAGSRKQGAKR